MQSCSTTVLPGTFLRMQWILSIDLSAQPCDLSLSAVEGNQLEVVDATTTTLPLLEDRDTLCKQDLVSIFEAIEAESRRSARDKKGSSDEEETEPSDSDAPTEEGDSDSGEAASIDDPVYQAAKESVNRLKEAIGKFSEWSAASVIIPPYDHLALNLNLPFGDAKNLDRIVDLEVQDVRTSSFSIPLSGR